MPLTTASPGRYPLFMRMFGHAILFLASQFLLPTQAWAEDNPTPQAAPPDLLKMKNGGMLRGTILELVPGQFVVIQTATGEQRKIPMTEVDYVGPASGVPGTPAPPAQKSADTPPVDDKLRPLVTIGGPEANLRFSASEGQEVTLHLRTSEAHGSQGVVATGYSRLCTAPCSMSMRAGSYRFALSQGENSPIEVKEPITIKDGDQLVAKYTSKRSKAIGWTAYGMSAMSVGLGVFLWGVFARTGGCEYRGYQGDCITEERGDPVRMTIGALLFTSGAIASTYAMFQTDRVSITVQPGIAGLRGGEVLGRVSSLRESVVPMWQGLSLAGQF